MGSDPMEVALAIVSLKDIDDEWWDRAIVDEEAWERSNSSLKGISRNI